MQPIALFGEFVDNTALEFRVIEKQINNFQIKLPKEQLYAVIKFMFSNSGIQKKI